MQSEFIGVSYPSFSNCFRSLSGNFSCNIILPSNVPVHHKHALSGVTTWIFAIAWHIEPSSFNIILHPVSMNGIK